MHLRGRRLSTKLQHPTHHWGEDGEVRGNETWNHRKLLAQRPSVTSIFNADEVLIVSFAFQIPLNP